MHLKVLMYLSKAKAKIYILLIFSTCDCGNISNVKEKAEIAFVIKPIYDSDFEFPEIRLSNSDNDPRLV